MPITGTEDQIMDRWVALERERTNTEEWISDFAPECLNEHRRDHIEGIRAEIAEIEAHFAKLDAAAR